MESAGARGRGGARHSGASSWCRRAPPAASRCGPQTPRTGTPAHGGLAQAEDVALVLHTSGTTSRPKIVPLRHVNVTASALPHRAHAAR